MTQSELIDAAIKLTAVRSSENLAKILKKFLSDLYGEENVGVYDLYWKRGGDEYEVMVNELYGKGSQIFGIEENPLLHKCYTKRIPLGDINAGEERTSLAFPVIYKKELKQIVRIVVPLSADLIPQPLATLLEMYKNLYIVLNEKDRDYLTSLYNRESFNRIANLICNDKYGFEKGVEESNTFLALLDIDHFKSVNDKHGHLIGDEVLIRFSQVMSESFRREDYCFRYGGEEFVLIFQTGRPADAFPVLDRFRAAVESTSFPRVDTITVSIGFVQIREKTDPFILSDMADRALYYAKENGRNQVQSFEALLEKGAIVSPDLPDSDVHLWN